jgi:ribonuclease P protein component
VTVVAASSPAGETRIGLVVGRSAGNAVTRNRIKRRLRHALAGLSMEQGMDYVVIADGRVAQAPFDDVRAALARGMVRGS